MKKIKLHKYQMPFSWDEVAIGDIVKNIITIDIGTKREVLSREEAEERHFSESDFVISIVGPKDKGANIVGGSCFHVVFDDVDNEEWGLVGYEHMTDEQAEEIAFLISITNCSRLIVHCHAGICRSSAVMRAFLEWQFGENSPVIKRFFEGGRYFPNPWVREKMRKAFSKISKNENTNTGSC